MLMWQRQERSIIRTDTAPAPFMLELWCSRSATPMPLCPPSAAALSPVAVCLSVCLPVRQSHLVPSVADLLPSLPPVSHNAHGPCACLSVQMYIPQNMSAWLTLCLSLCLSLCVSVSSWAASKTTAAAQSGYKIDIMSVVVLLLCPG